MPDHRIRVLRRQYTDRGGISENRFNVVLDLTAKVPEKSYLFIGSVDVGRYDKELRNKAIKLANEIIDEVVKRKRQITTNLVNRLLNKYGLERRSRQLRTSFESGGLLIIPASSFKGAVRSRLEYKFIIKDGETLSCYSVESKYIEGNIERHLKFWGEDVNRMRGSCDANKSNNVCIVCDIFGAPGLASRVLFTDLIPVKKTKLIEITLPDLKLKYHVIPPGTSFTFRLTGYNMSLEDLGLIFTAMEIFTNSPILIGRFKYRYNPVVGRDVYKKYFGLLNIELKNIIYSYPKIEHSVDDLKRLAREAVEKYVEAGFLDLMKGVIKL